MRSERLAAVGVVGGIVAASLVGDGDDAEEAEGAEEQKGVPCPECGERFDNRGLYPHLTRGHEFDEERARELTENTLHND